MPYIGEVDFFYRGAGSRGARVGYCPRGFSRYRKVDKRGNRQSISSGPLRFLKLLPPLNLKHPSNGLWDATETASRYKEPLKNFSCSNDRSRLGLALKSAWRCTLVVLCNFTVIFPFLIIFLLWFP